MLAAYGWSDIPVPPYIKPVTGVDELAFARFEDDVIDRLFALNAERAEEERLRGASNAPPHTAPPPDGGAGLVLTSPPRASPSRKKRK